MTKASSYCCCIAGLCLAVCGCASTSTPYLSYGVQRVAGDDVAAAMNVSRGVLQEMGYSVDRFDPSTGVITTQPIIDADQTRASGDVPRLSTVGELQRVVQFRVARTAEGLNLYCQVAVCEQVTEAHRLFQNDLAGSDRPGRTAIHRDAATTPEQNTVWRTVRRDRSAERSILDAIRGQIDGG